MNKMSLTPKSMPPTPTNDHLIIISHPLPKARPLWDLAVTWPDSQVLKSEVRKLVILIHNDNYILRLVTLAEHTSDYGKQR